MTTKSKRLLWLVLIATGLICATIVKALWNEYTFPWTPFLPSFSSQEAKARGTLVCEFSVSPRTFAWNGETLQIEEAWVEEAADLHYFLVWYPYYEKPGWHYLCLTLSTEGGAALSEKALSPLPRLSMEGQPDGFSYLYPYPPHRNGVFSWHHYDPSGVSSPKVVVLSRSNEVKGGPFLLQPRKGKGDSVNNH